MWTVADTYFGAHRTSLPIVLTQWKNTCIGLMVRERKRPSDLLTSDLPHCHFRQHPLWWPPFFQKTSFYRRAGNQSNFYQMTLALRFSDTSLLFLLISQLFKSTMIVCAQNPSAWEADTGEDCHGYEAIQGYIVSSRSFWERQQDFIFLKNLYLHIKIQINIYNLSSI